MSIMDSYSEWVHETWFPKHCETCEVCAAGGTLHCCPEAEEMLDPEEC